MAFGHSFVYNKLFSFLLSTSLKLPQCNSTDETVNFLWYAHNLLEAGSDFCKVYLILWRIYLYIVSETCFYKMQ